MLKYNNLNLNNLNFNILLTVYWFAQFFAPNDNSQTIAMTPVQIFFNSPFIFDKGLKAFEIVVVLIILSIIFKYSNKIKLKKGFYYNLFIITIIITLLNQFNPNNEFTFIDYFFSYKVRTLYLFIIFYTLIFFIEKDLCLKIISQFINIGLKVSLVVCIYGLAGFVIKKGPILYDRHVTFVAGDVLRLLVCFSVITLGLYLKTKKKKYLIHYLLVVLTLFLSYRRTNLIIALIVTVIIISIYFLKKYNIFNMWLRFGLLIFVLIFLGRYVENRYPDYFNRYLSAFNFFMGIETKGEFSDSGHFVQSVTMSRYFLKNLHIFWGSGFKNRDDAYVEGQTVWIHNNVVSSWAYYGMHMTLYLLLIFLIILFKLIKYCRLKLIDESHFSDASFVKIGVLSYLIVAHLAGWFTGWSFFAYFHQNSFSLFVILFSFTRIDYLNFEIKKNNDLLSE